MLRRYILAAGALLLVFLACTQAARSETDRYKWLRVYDSASALNGVVEPPSDFARLPAPDTSFAAWLRHLPLLPDTTPVRLFDGRLKSRQDVHYAVVNIDVGDTDLQQCADAVIRLA